MSSDDRLRRISVTGLGYVGLPVAVSFARAGFEVVGFDLDEQRVAQLRSGDDRTKEVDAAELTSDKLTLTTDSSALASADFHIVTVPTPITVARLPDLDPLCSASKTLGALLKPGDIVIYESTVYPGATEEVCVPILEAASGLIYNQDFFVGYSPERINPGDKVHRFDSIIKVVSGSNLETLKTVSETYGRVVRAGIYEAPSIKVAEAAKVIENTQRDLNIALMNELALIFEKMNIRTKDVLDAAGTKWNFLKFTPGLVGGHCIGVDPYYLTTKAEMCGYHPEVILAGRRTNDGMGRFIARKLIKNLIRTSHAGTARVGVMGLTFKENVPDLRNSRVPDIVSELLDFGIPALIHDPLADAREALHEYGAHLHDLSEIRDLDALVLAVPHSTYLDGIEELFAMLRPGGLFFDIKSAIDPSRVPQQLSYWSL